MELPFSWQEATLTVLLYGYYTISSLYEDMDPNLWLMLHVIVLISAILLGLIVLRDRVLVYLLLPSQIIASMHATQHAHARQQFQTRFGGHWVDVTLTTSDGIKLDAGEFRNPNVSLRIGQPEKWIVWLNANGVCLEENLDFGADYAISVGCNALLFNYRGVGKSGGKPRTGWDLVKVPHLTLTHCHRPPLIRVKVRVYPFLLSPLAQRGIVLHCLSP